MNKNIEIDKDRIIQQLQEESELKTKWIALLAHDFKGLFSNIHWLLNAYENKVISEELFKTMLPEINQQVERNQNTFIDTCEWVRSEMGDGDVQLTAIKIGELLDVIQDELTALLTLKKVSIDLVGDESLVFKNEPVLVRFILRKIIENAIKYSYNGGKIEVEASSNSTSIRIQIKDEGVGMKDRVKGTLFTLDGNPSTGTENEKGAGLSLIIVKKFIDHIGAQMNVTLSETVGTVFEILFPIKE